MQLEATKMHMSGESLLIILLVGLIAGWLAGQIVQGTGFGILGDLLIGIAGLHWQLAPSATRPPPRFGPHLGNHQRHHRRVVTVAGRQARSWRRRMAQKLERKLGKTLVVIQTISCSMQTARQVAVVNP